MLKCRQWDTKATNYISVGEIWCDASVPSAYKCLDNSCILQDPFSVGSDAELAGWGNALLGNEVLDPIISLTFRETLCVDWLTVTDPNYEFLFKYDYGSFACHEGHVFKCEARDLC